MFGATAVRNIKMWRLRNLAKKFYFCKFKRVRVRGFLHTMVNILVSYMNIVS
jgi:hypothetical protein